jgi:hypothetical protein
MKPELTLIEADELLRFAIDYCKPERNVEDVIAWLDDRSTYALRCLRLTGAFRSWWFQQH